MGVPAWAIVLVVGSLLVSSWMFTVSGSMRASERDISAYRAVAFVIATPAISAGVMLFFWGYKMMLSALNAGS